MAKNKKKQQGGSVESYMGGLTDKGFNYNGAWGGTMQNGGFLPQAQNGWLEKLTSTLNPYNWRVEDYSKEKDFTKAYSTAKKAGEEEFMYKGKRYNTKYAGTPRQEVGAYGVNGKPVSNKDLYDVAQVNVYSPLSKKYLPGHIEASIGEDELSVDYSRIGNSAFGIGAPEDAKIFNVYGVDYPKFANKVTSLPMGDYSTLFDTEYKPSTWNLITNNCADNVCDAFGIPRSKGIETPSNTISKIEKKYPTLNVTGRTYEDYKKMADKLEVSLANKILPQAENILGIANSPDLKDLKTKFIKSIQNALSEEGYDLPNSTKESKSAYKQFDGVYGPETKKALENWQKKNRSFQMGGMLSGNTGNMYSREGAPSNGKYAKKTKASAEEGMEILPDPTDPDRKYKLSATIASAKDILNPLLRAKDPAKYDAWTKGRVAALREKGMPAMREYMEQNPISIYLSPQEVKDALSKQREGFYEDYLGAIRGLKEIEHEVGAPMRDTLHGGIEGQGELENLNYGWRFATMPVNTAKGVTVGGKHVPEESFRYSYDPVKDAYKKEQYKNGGKMMSYYQAGLDFEPKTISKKGSKIKKDNDGYWNPENWGKPVEIDSNEITMEGVYQPLLGISDTGDVQMMYPGEDYEFNGESVTEYPVAQAGRNINQLDEAPLKKLDDLLNFTNMGKKRNIKKGQMGIASVTPTTLDLSMNAAMATAPKKLPTTPPSFSDQVPQQYSPSPYATNTLQGFDAGSLGSSPLAKTVQNVQRVVKALEERKKAKVFKNVSEIVKEAATSKPDMPKRKYVRPEDNLLSPDQSSFQSFGTGYDILGMAREGMQIGGNLTEIQNMYNPGTLYDGLGYEPLEDSQMKQYKKGGRLPHAQTGMEMQTAMQVMDLGLGLQGAIPEAIINRKTKKWTEEGMQNMQQGAYNQSLSNQFGAFMKDGGWVSHDWQPQVITKFGDYTMDQLLSPPNDAEMLRAGGNVRNIRSNYMGDDEKLSMMAMGGNLQTHWGGKGEVMSYNPYSPGSGETVMLRGQSHEETDGRGNSGIGMSYGGNMVEAERGEPVAEMEEGGAVGDTSAVVFGNMMIPSYGVSELGDDKSKGRKFKSYAADLSKNEAKQNKLVDKATKLIDDTDADSPFDLLKMNAGMAMLTGADMKLKDLANKKKTLAGIQNAILDTAEEMGLESDALARGKFMQAKKGAKIPKGQTGVLLPKDEFDFMSRGYNTPQIDFGGEYSRYIRPMSTSTPAPTAPFSPFEIDLQKGAENPYAWNSPASSFQKPTNADSYPLYSMQTEGTPTDSEPVVELTKKMLRKLTKDNKSESSKIKDFFNQNKELIGMGYNELLPYIRPTNKLPLDPSQFMGEQLALATNTLEPVQAQTFKPMLETRAPKMSAQEALNKNQADFNAMARQIGNNPAALSMLAAQKQAADRQTIAQVEATNIQQEMAANNRNIAMLNDASLKNLAILDTQFQRQAQAKSNTKAQAQVALNSIASKIGQNKLENFQSGVMQNMYNYRFGPQGRIINYNPLAQFNTQQLAGSLTDEMKQALAEQSPELGVKVKEKEKSRNGSIVKAIKNL
jgi:peptidoglycan hydrolase-like protein with peptidoglycan-binding domain